MNGELQLYNCSIFNRTFLNQWIGFIFRSMSQAVLWFFFFFRFHFISVFGAFDFWHLVDIFSISLSGNASHTIWFLNTGKKTQTRPLSFRHSTIHRERKRVRCTVPFAIAYTNKLKHWPRATKIVLQLYNMQITFRFVFGIDL